jgi:hypothetical protein
MKYFRIVLIFLLLNFLLIFNCQSINNLRYNDENNLNDKIKVNKTLYIVLITFIIFIFFILIFFAILYIKVIIKNERKKKSLIKYKKNYFLQEIVKPIIYKNNNLIQEGVDLCPICLQNFLSNTSKIFITSCKHIFHFYCFKKYILSSSQCECPICKFNFFSDIDENKIDIGKLKPIIELDENDNPEFENKKQNLMLKENNSKSSVANFQDASVNFYYNY